MTEPLSDAKIVESWTKNVDPWTEAVRAGQIESRTLVTNKAIVDAVLSRAPHSVLDIGCGEGWLVRALGEHGIRAIGVDVVAGLVEQARRGAGEAVGERGGGASAFSVASYEDIATGKLRVSVDLAVANFSLIGKESVEALLVAAHRLLTTNGSLVIQTLHPVTMNGESSHPYADGWRSGSWAGFSSAFTDPAPWYFRTMGSWMRLLIESNWRLLEVREPMHPVSGQPASVIFIAQTAG